MEIKRTSQRANAVNSCGEWISSASVLEGVSASSFIAGFGLFTISIIVHGNFSGVLSNAVKS